MSVPSERITVEGGGFSGSYSSGGGRSRIWSKAAKLYKANGRELDKVDFDVGRVEGSQRADHLVALHGKQADFGLQGEAFFLAAARHPLVVPDDILGAAKGICCRASYLTMSGIFFDSTGGSLMNRAKPLWPETEIATLSPRTELRERNCVRASEISSSALASGWLRSLGYSM